MPTKTPRDEHKWQKAKDIAKEQGKTEDYAYIMGIYKKMKPDYTFKSGPGAKEAYHRVMARWLRTASDMPLRTLLAVLRAAHQAHWTAHWTVKGTAFLCRPRTVWPVIQRNPGGNRRACRKDRRPLWK